MFRLLAILVTFAITAQADEKIWSAIVLASNPERGQAPRKPPVELAAYADKLARHFPYQQFEIVGSATKNMGCNQQERWLVPGPTFLVGAQAEREAKGYRINLEVFQERRRLLQAETRLGLKCPLFVGGPKHARGQLIIVFEVQP